MKKTIAILNRTIKSVIRDIKTYIKINAIYPYKYKDSKIESYIIDESILGKELLIKPNVSISSTLKSIGNYTYIGDGTTILNCKKIGNYSCISHDVKIGLDNHELEVVGTSPIFYDKNRGWVKQNLQQKQEPTIIGNDVLISANAMIMSGVKISTGAVIAAGAFVNKDVPPYAIVAGIPAKIIRYRFEESLQKKLLSSQWWEKHKEELIKHQNNFSNIEKFTELI